MLALGPQRGTEHPHCPTHLFPPPHGETVLPRHTHEEAGWGGCGMCLSKERAKSGFELQTQGQVPSTGSTAGGQWLPPWP